MKSQETLQACNGIALLLPLLKTNDIFNIYFYDKISNNFTYNNFKILQFSK